jgi:hypothetical protein
MHLTTGPQSPAAKAAVAQNARTHGLTGKALIILPAQQAEFDALAATLASELAPHGALEHELARQLLHAQWNLRRCDAAEMALQSDPDCDPLASTDEALQRQLDRVHRYRRAHLRAWHAALRELRHLQTNRVLQATPEPDPEASATPHTPLVDEMKLARFDALQSTRAVAEARINDLEARANSRLAETEFQQWWNHEERKLDLIVNGAS